MLIHECVSIMDCRSVIHDWRLKCKEIMSKNEMEIGELNKIYDRKEPITSVMHVVNALSNYLIFDRCSELVSQFNKEISVRLLLKISKHVYTRNVSYESSMESELFRFADYLIEID